MTTHADHQKNIIFPDEFTYFSKYLLGIKPSNKLHGAYKIGILKHPSVSSKELAIVSASLRHPRTIPYLDAYLALFSPRSELRRRLYITFCILETQPEYAQRFLSKRHSWIYAAFIGFVGIRAIVKIPVGFVIAKVLSR